LALYARIGRRPNEAVTEGAIGIWLPGQGFLLSFARTAATADIAAGPLRFHCLAPLVTWELRCDGPGRLFERAEHLATARDAYRTVPATVALRFTAWGEPLSFDSGLAEGVATAHYEQPGSLAGTLIVDGRRHPLAGRGMRDHSWGVRDWWLFPWNWTSGHFTDGSFVHAARSIVPGLELFATGYTVAPDGALLPATRVDNEVEVDAERLPTAARQRIGDVAFTTEPVGHAPILLVAPDGRETRFPRAMCRYTTADGVVGTGWTEYNWPP